MNAAMRDGARFTDLSTAVRRLMAGLDDLVETCIQKSERRGLLLSKGAESMLADSLLTCLYRFHTGIERMFEMISREVDGERSIYPEWDLELLQAMVTAQRGRRPAVLSEASWAALKDSKHFALSFPDAYRHEYETDWVFDRFGELGQAWPKIRADLTTFLAWLDHERAKRDPGDRLDDQACLGRNEFEQERLDLLGRVRPAGEALRALGAKEVILFGSILRPNFFDRASDIDILVLGLPDDLVLRALGAVERATGIFEREINLVFDQMAPTSLVEEARRLGVPL